MVEAVHFVVVATTIEEIDKFLSVHSTSGLKDVNVEEMRRTIPKLFQYLDDHEFVSCKKGLVLAGLLSNLTVSNYGNFTAQQFYDFTQSMVSCLMTRGSCATDTVVVSS